MHNRVPSSIFYQDNNLLMNGKLEIDIKLLMQQGQGEGSPCWQLMRTLIMHALKLTTQKQIQSKSLLYTGLSIGGPLSPV